MKKKRKKISLPDNCVLRIFPRREVEKKGRRAHMRSCVSPLSRPIGEKKKREGRKTKKREKKGSNKKGNRCPTFP